MSGISEAAKAKAEAMLAEVHHREDCTMSAYHPDQCGCNLRDATVEIAGFVQQVSDAAKRVCNLAERVELNSRQRDVLDDLAPFILPEPVDGVQALDDIIRQRFQWHNAGKHVAAELAERGFQIREVQS